MQSEIIDAIGKLSVEVIAILALAIALFFQGKAIMALAKEIKKIAESNLSVKETVQTVEKNTEKILIKLEKEIAWQHE